MSVDVCLVQMPYAAVERPSIALGTLHAALAGTEISSTVVYPNLTFAEDLGLDVYSALVKIAGHTLVGEWTFAGAAFPDFTPDHEAFLRLNEADLSSLATSLSRGPGRNASVIEFLRGVRDAAALFVERVAERVLALEPRLVGCSSTFQQHCASLALLRRIRELAPDVLTMIGGGNCEGAMGRATHRGFAWVDFVVSGEADTLFRELCSTVLIHGRDTAEAALPYGVFGPCHRAALQNGSCGEAPRAVVRDLDALPVPIYDHYFAALRDSPLAPYVEPGLLVETARGCWWGDKSHCTFCGLNGSGMSYRSKTAPRVVHELAQLSERHGLTRFEAVDNIIDPRYFDSVFAAPELADRRYQMFYETKANLGRHQLRRLADAGVRWIQPGIESLHPQMVRLFRKGNLVWTSLQMLKWALEYGVRVEWLFLFGAPGEADEWYAEMAGWLPALTHLQAPASLARVEYDRFSPYQERPQEFGISISRYRTYDYVYPLAEEDAADLAYFFEDYGTDRGLLDPARFPGLTAWYGEAVRWRLPWLKLAVGQAEQAPQLIRRESSSGLHILDTRACASEREYLLPSSAAAMLRACDQALPRERLAAALAEQGALCPSQRELGALCEELIRRRLLLEVQGRLLDLTLPPDTPPLPTSYPGGELALRRYARDRKLWRQAATGGLAIALNAASEPCRDWPAAESAEGPHA